MKIPKAKIQRISEKMAEDLKKISRERHGSIDIDMPKAISMERLTDAVTRYPEWESIKYKLKREQRKEKLR